MCFEVSSVSLLSLGLSGGCSSLNTPGDSSPLASPATPGSEVSLLSDIELTFLLDCIESVLFTISEPFPNYVKPNKKILPRN